MAPLRKYSASGEINSRVQNPQQVFTRMKEKFPDAHLFELDGLSVEYPDWWFNVRMSNTEPLCRLNLEADTPEKMAEKRDLVLNLIRSC